MSLHTHTHTHKHTVSLVEMTGSGFSQAAGGQRSCWAWVSCFHAVAAGSLPALPASEVGWNNDWDLLPHIHGGHCVCFAHPLKCRLVIVSLHCVINCLNLISGNFGVMLSFYIYGILNNNLYSVIMRVTDICVPTINTKNNLIKKTCTKLMFFWKTSRLYWNFKI